MLEIFLKTLPFFAIIGLGYGAAKTKFFSEEATGYLTKFVFYFALSAMLFRFSANLSFAELVDVRFISAYLWGTAFVYGLAMAVSFYVGRNIEESRDRGAMCGDRQCRIPRYPNAGALDGRCCGQVGDAGSGD